MSLDAMPTAPLFGSLHADAFRLFTGRLRWFYADLLEHLSEAVFGDGGVVARAEVLEAIRLYVDKHAPQPGDEAEAEGDREFLAAPDSAARASVAYNRLHATGWLVEHRDRYRRLADLDAAARLVLDTLLDIKAGRLRSYGGEVLQVLTLLEAARLDPENRSEAVRNAARSARSFLNHLRSVGGAMRKAEEAIVAQRDPGALFQAFFDDFVAKYLIEDFKRLRTQSNPFRFRVRILDLASDIERDDLLLRQLGEAYAREARAPDAERGIETVLEELALIQRVFAELDTYLELMEDTNRRVEKRIRNSVRYLDRISETRSERIAAAFRALAAAPVDAAAVLDLPGRTLADSLPLGPNHLYQTQARRAVAGPQPIRRAAPDPAFVAYQQALQGYRQRSVVVPRRVIDYLEQAMRGRASVRAHDLPLASLDDFFVFERLRALEFIEGGALAPLYRVVREPGWVENDWITCPDFTIVRQTEAADAR